MGDEARRDTGAPNGEKRLGCLVSPQMSSPALLQHGSIDAVEK